MFQEGCKPRLSFMQFSLNKNVIGYSLIRIYRECAFAVNQGNFKRSVELEKFGLTIAWEKLNTGHYAKVDDAWRELYSTFSACKAVRLAYAGNHKVIFYFFIH